MRRRKVAVQVYWLLLLLNFAPARGEAAAGTLLTHRITERMSQRDAYNAVVLEGLNRNVRPRYGLEFHSITYRTVDVRGRPAVASGLVVIPVGAERLPVVSYQHGTSIEKSQAPSNPHSSDIFEVALIYASTGYLVVAADYLGLGTSFGMHPFLHAATEASACRDMLRASRQLCRQLDLPWGPQLFLAGYSQGGHATMALQQALEADAEHEFTVTASAPQLGPYDLSGVQFNFALRQRRSPTLTLAVGYILYAYSQIYQPFPTLQEMFTPAYAAYLPRLLDGRHSTLSVLLRLPATPHDILNPAFVAAMRADPQHPVRQALRENDVYDWRPLAPVRLYYVRDDNIVSPDNTLAACANMCKRGGNVQTVDLGYPYNHFSAFGPAQVAAKRWFDTFPGS
ncbi:MAG: alpha/beta hydrolase family protein [Armatimonadota bacterium]